MKEAYLSSNSGKSNTSNVSTNPLGIPINLRYVGISTLNKVIEDFDLKFKKSNLRYVGISTLNKVIEDFDLKFKKSNLRYVGISYLVKANM